MLLISYYWPPAGGAGVQRWLKMCKYLPENGVECTVLTVATEVATYPLIDTAFEDEVREDVEVVRTHSREALAWYARLFGKKNVPHGGFANVDTGSTQSKISRWIRGNFFIPDARRGWSRFAIKAARDIISRKGIELLVSTGPPHSSHLIALELKASHQLPWIADFRDPWTDIYYYGQLLHSAPARRLDARLEQQVMLGCDRLIAVCPSNARLYSKKLPAHASDKISIITNGYDPDDFGSTTKASKAPEPKALKIAYTGTIAGTYRAEPIFRILEKLPFPWELHMAGKVPDDIAALLRQMHTGAKVQMHGYLPHNESIALLQSSDVLLHILPDTEANRMGTTGKLFEYIGAGKPILNFGPKEGDAAIFIAEAGAGQSFSREDESGVLNYLQKLHKEGSPNREPSEQFSRSHLAARLAKLAHELVKSSSAQDGEG